MEPFDQNFKEYLILKNISRSAKVSISTLRRLKDRQLRAHLLALHGSGSPLSELSEYIAAFYDVDVTPPQLRKVLQRTDQEAWKNAADSYRQHRDMKRQEKIISALGK
ncbi:MAG: hypothetical protein F9K32_00845 [Desulfobulbaceae bacterium]|nr:MAG: hypothetical protein F9K32_00845 [Desulfobulbaceae bacterium]